MQHRTTPHTRRTSGTVAMPAAHQRPPSRTRTPAAPTSGTHRGTHRSRQNDAKQWPCRQFCNAVRPTLHRRSSHFSTPKSKLQAKTQTTENQHNRLNHLNQGRNERKICFPPLFSAPKGPPARNEKSQIRNSPQDGCHTPLLDFLALFWPFIWSFFVRFLTIFVFIWSFFVRFLTIFVFIWSFFWPFFGLFRAVAKMVANPSSSAHIPRRRAWSIWLRRIWSISVCRLHRRSA